MSTRRGFVRSALWGGLGVLALSSCKAGSAAPSRPSSSRREKLGVALLGLGSYSSDQLAPALQKTTYCELRGIVTGSPDKIPRWQERYRIGDAHVYDYSSLERIANDDAIQVVYIVTPTSLHAQFAIRAANAGKHVFCEKPMAMTVAECERIIEACKRNRVSLSVGYRMQHEPNTRTVMEYARSKPYGAQRALRAEAGYRSENAEGWRYSKSMGGGALYDMGVYTINGLRYASGMEPVRVRSASQGSARPEMFREVDETTSYELEFASGLIGVGRTSFGEEMNRLRVECESGWYQLEPMQSYTGVVGETSDGKRLDLPIDNQQARQMDDEALAILEKRPPLVPGEEGMTDIRIVNAIQQAAASGSPVEL